MKNDNEKISANEINKYIFCPYQWYYERLYGYKYLKAEHRKAIKKLNIKDKTTANFKKGQKFHKQYRLKRILILTAKLIFLIAIIFITIVLLNLYA